MGVVNNQTLAIRFAESFLLDPPGQVVKYSLCYEVQTQTFWKYHEGVWEAVERDDLIMLLRKKLRSLTDPLTMAKLRDIIEQAAMDVDRHNELNDGWISFNDGSWFPDTDEFAEHSPERFATIKVNALYNNLPKLEDGPDFSKFIKDICVDEGGEYFPEMADQLQEMCGYFLMSSSERAVSFFLSGKGRNGKSVLSGIVQEMIGQARVSNMALDELTADKFATSALVGKRLNVGDETNTHKDSTSAMFKKLVSVDRLKAERKFRDSFSYKPRAKYLFLVNGTPTFDGFDEAMKARIICIPFFRFFTEAERDWTLKERIVKNEMPVVIAWAMDGLRRLKRNKLRFTSTPQSQELLQQFENASSSLSEFFDERWEKSTEPYPATDFFEEYVQWCKDTGRRSMGNTRVGREIAERCGKGRHMRHLVTKAIVRGIMCQRKMVKELPPEVPSEHPNF
jgi:putative DNA primase/helicase